MVVFLVGNNSHIKSSLPIYAVSLVLTDFVEQCLEENRSLTTRDYQEIESIKQNPFLLTDSYLFKRIEPFLLPFYERRNGHSTSL